MEVTETFEMVMPLGPFSRVLTRLTTGVTDRRADLEAGFRFTLERLEEASEATQLAS